MFINSKEFFIPMKSVATIKLKVRHNKDLLEMSQTFRNAVQYAVDIGFQYRETNTFKLHHLCYKDIRREFGLPADFTIEAIAKASENLKSTNLEIKPVIKKAPISFNRKLFTFKPDNIRLATFIPKQRINIKVGIPEYYKRYLTWRYQTLEIITDRKNRMFFNITFSREVDIVNSCVATDIIGVDLGVNNLAVCSDGRVFQSPKTKLIQFNFMRKRLQAKGTKSAKRLLVKRRGRQKRYMANINHIVSKQIADKSLVFEDLTGIRDRNYKSKRFNRWLHNWAFAQLQSFATYKAVAKGNTVWFENPYLSSQECSNCGELGSRYAGSFVCSHCGFSAQADFNASCTLHRRHLVNSPIVSGYGSGTSLASIDAG